jgi:hypothetical protein
MVTATYAEGRGRARRHRPQGRQPRRRRQRWSRCPGLHYHLKHLHFRELGKIMLPSSVMICLGSLTWNACLCVFSQAGNLVISILYCISVGSDAINWIAAPFGCVRILSCVLLFYFGIFGIFCLFV